jgi:hypothetical protein
MPYYINHTDGTSLVTVVDGAVDQSATTIALVGKNFPTYGQYLNQNLVTMLENSASSAAPDTAKALLGQLWYDSANKKLNVYREGSTANFWQKLAMTTESDTAPANPRLGDLWWDTVNSQLKLFNTATNSWNIIGPQTTSDGNLYINGNNPFNLQVGGNTVLKIDTYGGVQLARNACVWGYDFYNTAVDLTTNNSYNTWVPISSIDRGNNFTQNTGNFLVNTDGAYRVYAHVTTLGGGNADTFNAISLQWQKNGTDANIDAQNNHTNVSTHQLVCSGIIEAKKNDIISLAYRTATNTYVSKTGSSYSIQLIG